ncbi:UNVERIFIED_CONTAM: hypothetical protein RMT77_003687 [Armadillidium vulgare]
MKIIKFLYLIFIFIIQFLYCYSQSKIKPITTFLNAKWPDTPLLLESAEYLADESPATFWALIDSVNDNNLLGYFEKTDKEKFDFLLQIADKFLSPSQISLLKFSLALRIYSPKIESFRQIALDRGIQNAECDIVVDINGDLICDPSRLDSVVKTAGKSQISVFTVDHIYPGGSEVSEVTAVLYGELGNAKLKEFHDKLKRYSELGEIRYIFRPYVHSPSSRKLRLSGYGVELQIKSTEYKAQDDTKLQEELNQEKDDEESDQEVEGFMFKKLKTLHPELKDNLNNLKSHLIASAEDMVPLKVWQLQHLSMQAAQRIMQSPEEERLSLFTNTAQNFPSQARSLTRTKVDDKMKKEILKNQNTLRSQADIGPNDASLLINGMYFDLDYTDIYTVLDHVKNEQRVMERLFKLGIKGDKLNDLLNLDMSETKIEYGIDIRDSAVYWMNDIEKDKGYRRWPSSIGELLRPTYPGMLRSIRKNLHNIVIVADPSKKDAAEIFKLIDAFLSNTSPIRFGIVFAVNSDKKVTGYDDAGVAILSAFNYVVQSFEDNENANHKGLQFLIDLYATVTDDVTVDDVTGFFRKRYKSEDLDDVFGFDSDFDVGRQLARMFVDKGGFRSFPQALMNGVPLPEKYLTVDDFEEIILMEVMKNTQMLQRAVFKGEIDDGKDVIDWLMSMPNIMPRLNDRILSNKHSKFLDMSEKYESSLQKFEPDDFAALSIPQMTAVIANSCRYIAYKNDDTLRPLSVWVFADFETEQGRAVLLEAIKYTRESNGLRICAISNSANPGVFSKAVEIAQATLSPPVIRQFLVKILDSENATKIASGSKSVTDFIVTGMEEEAFKSRMSTFQMKILKMHSLYSSKVLGLTPGKTTVVANGRTLGSFTSNETFSDEDFALLERFFLSSVGEKVLKVLKDNESEKSSEMLMRVSSILQTKSQSKARTDVPVSSDQFSVIKIPARDPSSPAFELLAICDPASGAAQKLGQVLQILHQVLNANIRIVMNAIEKHSEMPLKSFYRFVLQAEPLFNGNGELEPGPLARFTGLPETTILTQNYHVPENWLVEVVKSIHDLDNIKLEQVESGVHSEFELEHLLLEGHCYEQSTGNPPRGLQFTLGTRENPLMVDTIVMANLGYFQLKANPGAMILRLRVGRSSDIYNIVSHEGTETPTGQDDVMVMINSFRSHVIKVKVTKKPDKQNVDLLADEDEESGGLWGTISSTFSKHDKDDDEEDKYINIFSVASGHLYERFLRIMMISVRKHSSKPVKFWLIKNFISPNFKDSLSVLSKEYDFEYELVQYKWPRWLHQQTEKQRIIWGYKILFLDVLFPLDVKKIIFVDADQVVRADIKELYNFDLEGAPYGFVPFCDSRKEMEGFRFWKQGYWRSHLAGRKYHISALFVVDLKKFRRIAAGDRLRGQYQGLSQDPNSLSNLDQDLPNNMVHQVRIKSLPMEWLWCETWCDDDSKSYAKVIDLCNNPMTKEAKLEAAQRIILEWTDYDNSIKNTLSNISPSGNEKNLNGHLHQEL